MTTRFRFLVEDLLPASAAARRWYGVALAQALASHNPAQLNIEAVVAHGHRDELADLLVEANSFSSFHTSFFGSRTVRTAWRHGFPLPLGFGMTHAPSMLAPTFPHDHSNDPGSHLVVTLHDLAAFNAAHPDERARKRQELRIKQAWNYADALIVPTHAMAVELNEHYNFGERLHIISRFPLVPPRSFAQATPSRASAGNYLAYVADENELGGIQAAIDILTVKTMQDARLVIIDRRVPHHRGTDPLLLSEDTGIEPGRVVVVKPASRAEYAALLSSARAAIFTDTVESHHQALLDAWALSVPAIGAGTAGFRETAGDGAFVLPAGSGPEKIAQAVDQLSRSSKDRERLITRGRDRLTAFNPGDVAELIWDLHADLAGA